MHRGFVQIVSSQIVGQRTETADTRRIEISQFLHLAVVAYHQTQHSGGYEDSPKLNGQSGGTVDKTLEDLAAETGNDHEYYNMPDDNELAGALEEEDVESSVVPTSSPRRVQFENSSSPPKSTPRYMSPKSSVKDKSVIGESTTAKKKKLVPVPQSTTKARLDDSDQNHEAWGESGAYDDGSTETPMKLAVPKFASKSPSSPSPKKSSSSPVSLPRSSPVKHLPMTPPAGKPQQGKIDDEGEVANEAGAVGTDLASSEEEIYISIQTDRESEFMTVIMSSLGDIAEDIQEGIYEELQNHLRVRLNDAVYAAGDIDSPDQFDDIVVKFLQSQEFIDEMVSLRDSTIEYVQSQLEGADDEEGIESEPTVPEYDGGDGFVSV